MGNLFDDSGNDPADRIASLLFVRQDDEDAEQPGIFPMTVRAPAPMASLITVMAEHAGLSRNEMVKLLLKVGISQSLRRIPPDLAADISEEATSRIDEFV